MVDCKRFFVSGRVQGVFFRAATLDAARRLCLTGWVRNTEDGLVELIACGDSAKLKQLEEWLWQGPTQARVEGVTVADAGNASFADFTISY